MNFASQRRELSGSPDRVTLIEAAKAERATTIPKGSTVKRREARRTFISKVMT